MSDANIEPQEGLLELRAIRAAAFGGPPITIDVRELWTFGRTAEQFAPIVEGHSLMLASWHAQIGGPGARNAERLDIDRSKEAGLVRHRHPYGMSNGVREASMISTPEAWILQVETVIGPLYSRQDEQE